jgi:hypothetical protein
VATFPAEQLGAAVCTTFGRGFSFREYSYAVWDYFPGYCYFLTAVRTLKSFNTMFWGNMRFCWSDFLWTCSIRMAVTLLQADEYEMLRKDDWQTKLFGRMSDLFLFNNSNIVSAMISRIASGLRSCTDVSGLRFLIVLVSGKRQQRILQNVYCYHFLRMYFVKWSHNVRAKHVCLSMLIEWIIYKSYM